MFLTDSTRLNKSSISIKNFVKSLREMYGEMKGSAKKAAAAKVAVRNTNPTAARIFAALGEISASLPPIFEFPLHFSKTEMSFLTLENSPVTF